MKVLAIGHVNEMIKWDGHFDYTSSAICIMNNTYVWLVTPYFGSVEPDQIKTVVMEEVTILCDDGLTSCLNQVPTCVMT